ncbi:MAG: chemotaxis protein CheR [Desulfobulbaceae bacterium]|nr:chemotaxis protein CheR [Desulfobulbaceae bacterium]
MDDRICVNFLQWALPRLHLRWKGFRKVRRQVCRRIDKRLAELKLSTIDSYQKYLEENPLEWSILDRLCRITISRFYRDSVVFNYFTENVFPALVTRFRGKNCTMIRVWSVGCASGEEPYTVAMLWHFMIRPIYPDLKLEILATDIDPVMIRRAEEACYTMSSLRDLPAEWLDRAFDERDGLYCLQKPLKEYVRFALLDIREDAPEGMFHVVLCRNLAFTYFDPDLQQRIVHKICNATERRGVLITGTHEIVASEGTGFVPWIEHMPILRKT